MILDVDKLLKVRSREKKNFPGETAPRRDPPGPESQHARPPHQHLLTAQSNGTPGTNIGCLRLYAQS